MLCEKVAREESVLKKRGKAPDERLLVEAAQKDPTRFAELYEGNFDRVYAFIVRRVNNRVEAQDLTAHVFQQALANLGRFEYRGAPFAAWLYRIAANAVADHFERRARERGTARTAEAESNPAAAGLDEVERRARLFGLVRRLPADQRRVIEMRFAEEKSIRETAQDLGRTEGAVKQLQFRALRTLRARMEESDG